MSKSSSVPHHRFAMAQDQLNVGLCTSPSVRPDIMNMMLRMMLLTVRQYMRKNVKMSPRDIPLRRSVPSGPSKFANLRRRTSRSTLQKLNVKRFQKSFAVHLDVTSSQAQRNALTRRRQLYQRYPKKLATWNHKSSASM